MKMTKANLDFFEELPRVEDAETVIACFQCSACVADCPAAARSPRFNPRDIMLKVLLGLEDELIVEDSVMWDCTTCYTCMERCPQGVLPIGVITARHYQNEQAMTMIHQAFPEPSEAGKGFEPQKIAFTCNWCPYAGADLAGVSRFQYPPNIRIIRFMCSGRIDPMFVFEAVEEVIAELGIEPERLRLAWISASEGQKFADTIREMVEDVKKLGPFDKQRLAYKASEKV